MMNNLNLLEKILENDHRGLIYIKEDGRIGGYTRLAKEMTGIILDRMHSHKGGKINEGDIVIIADNNLGEDDALTTKDLQAINIFDDKIKVGDALIAIGVYNNKKIEPVYKFVSDYNPNGAIEIERNYLGFNIFATIDFGKSEIHIAVNGENRGLTYFKSMGHMVVIDGATGNIKFFQAIGYGPRHEEIGELLRGKAYLPKPGEESEGDLVPTTGVEMEKILCGQAILEQITSSLHSLEGEIVQGVFEIHKRTMFCDIIPIKEGKGADGVYLIIQDASKLMSMIQSRNKTIELLEGQKKRRQFNGPALFDESRFKEFIGSDPSMNEVKQLACKASKAKFNVIITGESGTGKSRLAREIHQMCDERAPFVEVNCNAIAPSLFESELFGYAPGAFTGASHTGKAGYFEVADGGTIFLDEIGEIPLDIQVKLLHVLQNKRIYRVGSSKPIDVNVRVITATNSNLKELVAQGTFRQDLYYRINVFPICIPPLRERRGDLYVLINSILARICEGYEIENKRLSEEALNKMLAYNWPGNVRELENVMERAVMLCDSATIYKEHIIVDDSSAKGETLKEKLEREEQRLILGALMKNQNNRKKTMEELGVSKTVFYEKLKKYGVL